MSTKKLLTAIISAAAAGAAIGILLAPDSGDKTREKLVKKGRQSVDELITEGKSTWFKAKGKVQEGAGVAADELDDFLRHVIGKGERMWGKAKNKGKELANEAENEVDSAVNNGKKLANNLKERAS